jgi:hypothetical protein
MAAQEPNLLRNCRLLPSVFSSIMRKYDSGFLYNAASCDTVYEACRGASHSVGE